MTIAEIKARDIEDRCMLTVLIPLAIYRTTLLTTSEKFLLMEIDALDITQLNDESYNEHFIRFFMGLHPCNIHEMVIKLIRLDVVKKVMTPYGNMLQSIRENFDLLVEPEMC